MLAPPAPTSDLTVLLRAWSKGDASAFSALMQRVNGKLQRMAAQRLRGGDTPTLAAGDLLNESLLKLMGATPDWQNRAHFFGTMASTMRSVLVDHARARSAHKRGGDQQRVTWTISSLGEESNMMDLLTLDQLLNQLKALDSRAAQVLELTYFGGLARADIANVLGLSVPTVDRELKFARAWLGQALQRGLEA